MKRDKGLKWNEDDFRENERGRVKDRRPGVCKQAGWQTDLAARTVQQSCCWRWAPTLRTPHAACVTATHAAWLPPRPKSHHLPSASGHKAANDKASKLSFS